MKLYVPQERNRFLRTYNDIESAFFGHLGEDVPDCSFLDFDTSCHIHFKWISSEWSYDGECDVKFDQFRYHAVLKNGIIHEGHCWGSKDLVSKLTPIDSHDVFQPETSVDENAESN